MRVKDVVVMHRQEVQSVMGALLAAETLVAALEKAGFECRTEDGELDFVPRTLQGRLFSAREVLRASLS